MTKKRITVPQDIIGDAASDEMHANHSAQLARLKRIKGQVEGLERMIADRRYCTDIVMQAKAAGSALKAFEVAILESHLRGCVKNVMRSKDPFEAEKKIQEILDILK